MNAMLAGFMAAFGTLTPESQVVLSLRYHADRTLEEIAEALRTDRQRVVELHDAAVLKLHRVLLLTVQAP